MPQSLTGDLAAAALAARTGPDAVAAATSALEDLLVSSLMAADCPPVLRLLGSCAAEGGSGGWVIGHPKVPLSPARSALVGGFQAHLLDLDDVSDPVRGHPSAVILPALFAVAPAAVSGADLLAAYVIGLEVMARLGRALATHYPRGWHQTGTLGAIAATLACARLTRTEHDTAVRALAIAAQSSGALRVQFGTDAKPLAAGLAAQSAVDALTWAGLGLTAAPDVLGGPNGFLAVHDAAPTTVRSVLLDGFGASWSLLVDGLWTKTAPFCSAGIAPVQAAKAIADRRSGNTTPIARAVVRMRPGADQALVHRIPSTGEQGRFSAEYLVALTLLERPLDLGTLGPAAADPLAVDLSGRVVREHVPGGPPHSGSRDRWTEVEVEFLDGSSDSETVEVPDGAPSRPLGEAARAAKRRAAAGERADELHTLLAAAPNRPWRDTAVRLRSFNARAPRSNR